MRKTISLILIFILLANPVFAFGQVIPLAPSLLLASPGFPIKTFGNDKFLVYGSSNSLTQYIYDGEDIIRESRVTNTESRAPNTEFRYYYHYNGLGSVVALTDKSGRVVQSYNYDSFGNIMYPFWQRIQQPYTYTGREYDAET